MRNGHKGPFAGRQGVPRPQAKGGPLWGDWWITKDPAVETATSGREGDEHSLPEGPKMVDESQAALGKFVYL